MISISRILISPLIYSQIVNLNLATIALLTYYALLSDVLDGWLARKLECANSYGILLDPLCDKIFSMGIYLGLAHNPHFSETIYLGLKLKYLFIGLILKEIVFMSVAGVFVCFLRYPFHVFQASYIGKITFVLNILSCCALLFDFYPKTAVFTLILSATRSSLYYLRRLLHQFFE